MNKKQPPSLFETAAVCVYLQLKTHKTNMKLT